MSKHTKIRLGLVDTEAKPNSSYNMNDLQPFSKLIELKSDFLEPVDYATLEKNFFVLNGDKTILNNNDTENIDIGICSLEMAGSNSEFTNPPQLTITLSSPTNIGGLTFIFGKYDYCKDLNITYYLNDVLVESLNFNSDKTEYYCGNNTTKYTFDKAVVTFKKMSNPFRYLKITQIEFGRILTFTNDNIISCNILEEINLISNEISINTCDFEIHNEDDKFNILNPQGVYADLKTKLPIEVYAINKNNYNLMGRFYLKSWKSKGNDQATFKAEDFISIMDQLEYLRPKDTYNTIQDAPNKRNYMKFSNFLEDVTNNKYLYDCYENDVVDDKGINGIIFNDSIKNIIQKGLFTFGILVDSSRSKKIRFFNLENEEENLKTISSDRIFSDSVEVTKLPEYNEFIVYGYGYDESTDFVNKDNDKFFTIKTEEKDSVITIEFDKPQSFANLGLNSNGIPVFINNEKYPIQNITPFKISFALNEIGDVSFYSQEQEENKTQFVYESPTKMTNEQVNSLKVDECELIHKDASEEVNYIVASDVAKRLYNHYKNLYKIEFQFEFNDEKVGDYVEVETEYGRKIKGNIISLDIDLINEIATCVVEGRIVDNGINI